LMMAGQRGDWEPGRLGDKEIGKEEQ